MGFSVGPRMSELSFLGAVVQQLIVQAGKHSERQPPGQRGALILAGDFADGGSDDKMPAQHLTGHEGAQLFSQIDGQAWFDEGVGFFEKKLSYDCLA